LIVKGNCNGASAVAVYGGDGGNRTRVQKIRPSEIYERSRLIVSPPEIHPAKLPCGHSLRPESPLSLRAWPYGAAFRLWVACSLSGRKAGVADAVPVGAGRFCFYCGL